MPDVIATYAFVPEAGTAPKEAARWIADEETTGTWTDITTRTEYVRRLDGEVLEVTPRGKGFVARIRYPAEIFEPGNVPQYLSVEAGGGIHGHPDGTAAGARAMRQAGDAWMEGMTLAEYAKEHDERERALKKWGVVHG